MAHANVMFSCSQCSFTAQFESALVMHHQLHHEPPDELPTLTSPKVLAEKSHTMPRSMNCSYGEKKDHKLKLHVPDMQSVLVGSKASATKLLGKLKARISRTKILFAHPEEGADHSLNITDQYRDLSAHSECTSKAMKVESRSSALTGSLGDQKETFGCHLCSFDADRITVLDRHLLNDHKIGLENLLKLVMAKTKDGLFDDNPPPEIYGIRQPYYRPPDEIIEEGEFVIETVTPKIKILKHASTITDLQWSDIPNLKDNCRIISKEIDKLIKYPMDTWNKDDFMEKMQSLNDCMCKFVDSSNTLKKALTKEFDSKHSIRREREDAYYDMGLGDQESARDWERPHSENMDRSKFGDSRAEKSKFSSDSFYY